MSGGADFVNLLHSNFPLESFKHVRAKVQGARYYTDIHVRTDLDQRPKDALRAILGAYSQEVEIDV